MAEAVRDAPSCALRPVLYFAGANKVERDGRQGGRRPGATCDALRESIEQRDWAAVGHASKGGRLSLHNRRFPRKTYPRPRYTFCDVIQCGRPGCPGLPAARSHADTSLSPGRAQRPAHCRRGALLHFASTTCGTRVPGHGGDTEGSLSHPRAPPSPKPSPRGSPVKQRRVAGLPANQAPWPLVARAGRHCPPVPTTLSAALSSCLTVSPKK